jgi:hypothetical protein
MSLSTRLARLAIVACLLGFVAGVLPALATAESCPNEAVRFGPSANLPDCRAYELVSPAVKGDNSTFSGIHGFADGEHVLFSSLLPLPGSGSGEEGLALSSRTPGGWVTTALSVPAGPGEPYGYIEGGRTQFGVGFHLIHTVSLTSDFSSAFVNSPMQYGELDQNEQWNTFRVRLPSGAVSIESLPEGGPMTEALIDPPNVLSTTGRPEGVYVPGAFIAGNSADGSRVYFETTVQLPTALGTVQDTHLSGNELFERRGGHTYLVGVLPGGDVPGCGVEIGDGGETSLGKLKNGFGFEDTSAASLDGSNVVFSSPSGYSHSQDCPGVSEKFYLREDNGQPDAQTLELPGSYVSRTADQKKLFLASGNHLYEYDIASGQTIMVGENAQFGGLLGSSVDGSRVYISPGVFSGGDLSLYENGTVKPLPIPAEGMAYEGEESELGNLPPASNVKNRPAVSPDGSRLVFVDSKNLTSYDNKGHDEVYMYDATSDSIACISCNPDGSSPEKSSGLIVDVGNGEAGPADPKSGLVPNMYPAVSNDDAHVFFNSQEGLVPQDTNGLNDAYEWERAGTGTCGPSNTNYSQVSGGCVYLLSSGTGSNGSWVAGASEDGSNVFIATNDSLTPQVVEVSQEIYDARINGGFPYTQLEYGCDSGQCQGPQTPAPPLLAPPPSATFVGVGNPTPETSNKAKPKSKTPKHKKQPKKKHNGKHRKANKRTGKGRK